MALRATKAQNRVFYTDKLPQNATKHSVLHTSRWQVFLITKNEAQVLCVERDRAWLSERLRHLTARRLQFCFQSGPRCAQPGTWRTSVDALRQTPGARLDADSNTCCFFIKQSPTVLSLLQVKLSKSTNTPKNCHFQLVNVSFCVIQQLQVTPRWVSELVMDWHKLIKRAMNHRQGTHCQSPISLWILLVKFERLCAVRCGSVCLRSTTETL